MSASDSQPEQEPEKPRCRRWTFWRCFRWSCRGVALVVVALVVAVFFARGWLTDRGVAYLEERLRSQRIFFKHGPVSYDLSRGLVVEDLVLFETEAKRRPYLRISNIGMDVGLSSILLGEDVDVQKLDLSINRGSLKVYDDGEEVAEIRRLRFFGKSEPNWIQILSAEGVMNGVEVNATGNIRSQKRERPVNGEADEKRRKPKFAWLRNLDKWIEFEGDGKLPVLRLEVDVDKRDGAEESIHVAGQVSGEDVRWRGLPVDELDGEFTVTWSDRMVGISEARAVYRGQPIEAKLRYDLKAKRFEIDRVVSDADLVSLLGESPINLGEKVEMVRVAENPRLFFSGQVPIQDLFASSILVTCEKEGTVEIGKGERPLALSILSGGVRYANGTLNSEDLEVGLFGGRANLAGAINVSSVPVVYEAGGSLRGMPLATVMAHFGREGEWPGVLSGSFAGMGGFTLDSIEGTGDLTLEAEAWKLAGPVSLSKSMVRTDGLDVDFGGGVAAVAGWTDFNESPFSFQTAINMNGVSMQSLLDLAKVEKSMPGKVSGQFRFSGQPRLELISGKGDLQWSAEAFEISGPIAFKDKVVSLEQVAAKYGEGIATASAVFYPAESPIRYQGELELQHMPVQSLLEIAQVEKTMGGTLSGRFKGSGSTALTSIEGGGDLQFANEKLRVEGPYTLAAGLAQTGGLSVDLGSGAIGIKGKTDLTVSPRAYEGEVFVDGVAVQSLIDFVGSDRQVEGKVYAQFAGTASDSLSALDGMGAIRIEDGKLYSVPIFGQMKTFLTGVLPTFGKVQKSDLEASFVIRNGVLTSRDLVAASDMTRVEIDGDLNLVEKTADFSALAKVDGVVGVATNVVSRLLELEASGPVEDLDIRLKNKPANMAAGAVKEGVGIARGGVGMAKDGVTGLTKGARNVGEGAVRAGAGGGKAVGKGIGKLRGGGKKKGQKGKATEPVTPEPPSLPVKVDPPAEDSEQVPVPSP